MKNMSTYFVSDLECARGYGCPEEDRAMLLWNCGKCVLWDLLESCTEGVCMTCIMMSRGSWSMPGCVTLQAWVQARHSHLPSSTASQGINYTKALQVFSLIGSIITLEQISFFPILICLCFGLCVVCAHGHAEVRGQTMGISSLHHGS